MAKPPKKPKLEDIETEPGAAQMIPDLDIYRAANLLLKRRGEDAPIWTAMDQVAKTE